MNGYQDYHDESDADDEYERGLMSPAIEGDYTSSPTESEDPLSAENTPTTYSRHGGGFPSPKGPITSWTADQCADFVANLGFEQYADAFAEEEINGEALIELLHEELKDLGIASIGHRLTILRTIYDIKVQQNISIKHDHYVPISADANAPDAHATQDDVARIINQIKLRDERLVAAEEDLRTLREDLNRALEETRRLREDVLPVIRMAKDKNQPLPTPEGFTPTDTLPSPLNIVHPEPKTSGLSRKFSTKKLFLGGGGSVKMPSPTIHETSTLDPSAAAKAASSQLTASMSSQSSQPSPRSPSSPPYATPYTPHYRNAPSSRYASTADESWLHSNASARRGQAISSINTTPATIAEEVTQPRQRQQQADAGPNAMEFMKSFRVSMDEPCHKVLPVALKKYQIEDDWRQYSLYIVHGDQERCLGLQEKPLILFKQLASEGKKPMFMLRKHAAPQEGFIERTDGSASNTNLASLNTGGGSNSGPRITSYAGSTMQLPGGVL